MPQPIPVPVREVIYQQWREGASPHQAADQFGLSVRTVRHLRQRFGERGESGIVPSYRTGPPPARPAEKEQMRRTAECLRREHPTWGAPLIRVKLCGQFDPQTIPHARTLQRWFRDAGLGPALSGRRQPTESTRASRPHETWQMDASEEIVLADGQRVSWLRLVDEYTGAVLNTRVFPPSPLESCLRGRSPGLLARSVRAVGVAATDPCG